jgi:hypothetical protein
MQSVRQIMLNGKLHVLLLFKRINIILGRFQGKRRFQRVYERYAPGIYVSGERAFPRFYSVQGFAYTAIKIL